VSAYLLFSAAHREEVKQRYGLKAVGDVAKKLAEMWKDASAEEKEKYNQEAAALKEKYEVEKGAYIAKKGGEKVPTIMYFYILI